MNIKIRQENKDDYPAVYELIKRSFENLEISDKDEHELVNRLRKSRVFVPELSLVAQEGGKIVGYILFTEIKIGEKTFLTLAPVAVAPQMQGKGIGGLLIKKGHEIAKQMGYKGVVLIGHETYYPKFGYKRASGFGLKHSFDVPDEAFMAIELCDEGFLGADGIIEYAEEFLLG